jgi:hypothetical protein
MTVVNGPLDAAMAALKAQPYPWFLPAYSIRLTDFTVYTSLVQTYGFGSPVIIGLSPTAASALTGVAISQDTSFVGQSFNPQIFVHPSAQQVLGVPVTLTDSGGTIFISYATPYGRSDRVIWQWQCDVEFNPVAQPIITGKYEQQIVQYTGDGTSARLIPTTFPLDTGVVAIWICGGPATDDLNVFRHNNPSMGGTQVMGSGSAPDATHGIMTFTAAGFTVTAGTLVGITFANGNTRKYTAIVLRDSTSDNRYLRVGTYSGVGAGGAIFNVQAGSTAVTGAGFNSAWNGLVFTDTSQGTGTYVFTYISSTTGSLSRAFTGITGAINTTYSADLRPIAVPGKQTAVTHAWVWGRGVAYRSTDFTGDSSVSLAVEAYQVTGVIEALGVGTFTVGTANNVNTNAKLYDYMALSIDATFIAQHVFASFKVTGTAAPPVIAGGLGFTPTVAFGRQYTAGLTGALWKGPDHVGADSNYCGATGGFSDDPTTGITAMGPGTVTLSTDVAPNGVDGYGWAFVSGAVPLYNGPPLPYVKVPLGYVPDEGLVTGAGFPAGQLGPCGE